MPGWRTHSRNRIKPPEIRESKEVCVRGVQYGIVFNNRGRNLDVRHQITTRPKTF